MKTIVGFDTETTGLDQPKGHRIIEVAILKYDVDTRTLVDKYIQRIDPERSIDAKAQEVHGISYAELVGKPKWEDVAKEVGQRLDDCDAIIAHNVGFDLPFVGLELARVGEMIPRRETYCTMENGRWSTFDGKNPKLLELCFALGVPYDPALAHAAEYDVSRMMECLWRGMNRGFFTLPI